MIIKNKTMKLISMTDFVLEQYNIESNNGSFVDAVRYKRLTNNYARFLSQPLELWMFVPCDEDGNVLEEPKYYDLYINDYGSKDDYHESFKSLSNPGYKIFVDYQKAKERCLFIIKKLPKISELELLIDDETIELLTIGDDVELTPTAIKQIGL